MSTLEQELTGQFYRFELPGRGGQVCSEPVSIEPPFRAFPGYFAPLPPVRDEGRRHTFLSGIMEKLGQAVTGADQPQVGAEEDEPPQPGPGPRERQEIVEFQLSLPRDRKGLAGRLDQLLGSFAQCREPVSFEIVGTDGEALLQIAVGDKDAERLERHLALLFPGMTVVRTEDGLADAWQRTGSSFAVCECGLEREFMLPLELPHSDVYFPLLSALAALSENELGLMQVLFEPARHSWGGEALQAVSDGEGGPFFVNRPELLAGARAKFSRPLYAVVLRFAACAEESERAWQIVAEMMAGFVMDAHAAGNRLIPLSNDGYDGGDHERDLILRQSRRTGMLLNQEELRWLVRFPDDPVTAALLKSDNGTTHPAPGFTRQATSLQLGSNEHGGISNPVFLSDEHRFRHTHVIGASGTGKSTLLLNLIRQDIEAGAGVGVLDPHGDLIHHLLGIIPEERIQDVVLLDPSDEEFSIGFNVLSAHSDLEKTLLASDLVSIFARLSTSWGDQMNSVFQNAILAFLESSQGGTLADLRRFLLDKDFRSAFLKTVEDPEAVFYWEKGFPQLGGNKSIGPILTRLESFLSPRSIRYMVSQKSNRLDFANIMNGGKILLACLPQGRMGRENSHLLGSLLVAKLQQTAMSRQAMAEKDRQPFWLYIDEFQNFATPSMSEILAGARKYRLGLTLAHQDLAQLRRYPELSSAVLTNTCTRIVFRPGDEDAQSLAGGFAHFDTRALTGLATGEAICRVGQSDADFNLQVPAAEFKDTDEAGKRRAVVIKSSCVQYGRPKSEITAEMAANAAATSGASASSPSSRSPQSAFKPAASELPPSEVAPKASMDSPESVSDLPEGPETPPAAPAKREKPTIPKAFGVGGVLHTQMQKELKLTAESLGFRATIEKQLPGTLESTDLLLEREGVSVAVEITVTNTLDYELKNIGKCLRAGVSLVAVVGADDSKLKKLEAAARNTFSSQGEKLLGFFTSEGFISRLQEFVLSPPPPESLKRTESSTSHKGWKVKTTVVTLSPEEMKEREAEAARIIAASSRKRTN
jgi:hypothetical protein